jgi:transposase
MPAQRKYPPELIERAVRMVLDKQRETPGRQGILREVGDLLGIHPEALRHWVKNAELRRANGILKAAASSFAAELDPRPPR